ncbi:sporulation integral membrane protein YtvI [Tetzosporium hominis]|uniref:sporulation integral membrane protein YtvI n=1 Tax=Tetzosporium hominis TaxID=2020506 RepID=UPI001FAE9EF1|nr:sporulation integral membrane protein YtvI [Tetzosporium hominis]
MKVKRFDRPLIRNTVIFIILAILAFVILLVSVPIILALLVAIFVEPLVEFIQNRFKVTRKTSVIINYTVTFGLFILLFYFVITSLIARVIYWSKAFPSYLNDLGGIWTNIQNRMFDMTQGLPLEVVNSIQKEVDSTLSDIQESLLAIVNYENITALATELPSLLVSFIVFLIALFLFMLDLPMLRGKFFRYFSNETADKILFMYSGIKRVIFGFMKAQILVSFIILFVSLIGLYIIIPEYALVMSIVIWIIDVIPILGSIIVLAPWAIGAFAMGNFALGTKLSILAVILLIIRRSVEPKVMGAQMGLSPLAVLIAMFIGAKLFGLAGFIVGPLVVIIFTTAKEAGIIKLDFKL